MPARHSLLLTLTVIFALASCGDDPMSPERAMAGTLQMSMLDDRPVPFVLSFDRERNCVTIYEGGLLTLDGRGSFYITRDVESEMCGDGRQESATILHGRYRVSGEMIEFTPEVGNQFSGYGAPFKQVSPNAVRPMLVTFEADGHEYEYVDWPYR